MLRVVIAALAAAPIFSPPRPLDDDIELTLSAPRVVLLHPTAARTRINFTGRLDGEFSDPEKYYCLAEVWDWGDDTESVYEPDCDPYEPGAEVKRNFQAHHFFGPGRHTVTLRLQHGDDTVIAGRLDLQVRR